MEKKHSPAQAVKQILSSGKLTFICIIFSIAAIAAIGDVIENRIDFSDFEIFGFSIDLGKWIGYEAFEMLTTISDILFVFAIIGILPTILSAVAFWLVKVGSAAGDKCTKTALLGLNFFKIKFFYEVVTAILMLCIVGIIGIFAVVGLMGSGSGLLVAVVGLALVLGYYYILLKYNTNFLVMLMGASNTLRTNINMVTKSGMVIVFNYIAAVWLILTSFGGGIWGFIVGICDALCIIFVNRLFANYDSLYGYAKKEETKVTMERVANDPALERTAVALGIPRKYSKNPAEQKPSIMTALKKTIFGMQVAYIDDETPYTPTINTYAQPAQNTASQTATQSSAAPAAPKTYTRAADITDELTARYLALFSADEALADSRYQVCGERAFAKGTEPVTLAWAQVIVDGVSEKKILRTAFVNNAPVAVKEIKFTVIPKTNESSSLGIFKNVTLSCNAGTTDVFGAEFGLILPDNTTCGSIKVTYVEFADGMFRDKEGGEVFFSTEEKAEYDTQLYLSVMKKG